MIQEQISTSSPKCLDGNSGFGIVAQTSGMAPNVAREVSMLSGYTHQFAAGDSRNPVTFLHVVRRTGGTNRHIVSRVADCGNDYSGRTNRIAHHWIIEESDLSGLSCGPAAILSLQNFFRTQWNEKPQELPRDRKLPNPVVSAQKCTAWEQILGDAGWGGVLAERAENGDPVSLIFEPGMNILSLLAESFALLPPNIRWKLTFSTFFMKSQEPPGANKVQIKCILAGTDEEAFARLTPNTLVLDLRLRPTTLPVGKYVEVARTGVVNITKQVVPLPIPENQPTSLELPAQSQTQQFENNGDIFDLQMTSVGVPIQKPKILKRKLSRKSNISFRIKLILIPIILISVCAIGLYAYDYFIHKPQEQIRIAAAEKSEQERKEAEEKAAAAEKTEQERKEAEEKAAAAEKAEQERKEAEEKAVAAEKAERERKEAEAKAAAEKAEKERKEAEEKAAAEKKEQKEVIDGLAKSWNPQLLPFPPSTEETTVLNGSEKLWKYRDSISIQYYSYVDLNISFSDSPQYQLIVEQTTTESETEKTFYVFYFIEIIKNVSGADTIKPKKDIAKLILSNDKGLYFRWIRNNIGSNAQGLPHGQFNRLLLSHIEIKLGENTKDFSLFEPAQYKQTDNNAPKLGQPFKLWKGKDNTKDFLNSSKDEGSFWLTLSDKVILEVKNGELRSKGADKPKKFEISNFTGDLPNVLAKPLKITFPEWKNDDQIPFHGTLSLVNASESQDNLQVKIELKIDRGDIESKFTQAKRERDNAEEEIKKRTGKKRGDIDQIISDTNDRFQKTSQEKQDDKWKKQLEEWSTLRDEFYTKKHTVETLKNLKEEIDQFEKGPFLPTPFSLYLKRYNKPEEKLLLFEIQPMDTKK